jgi:hypothetical protein
MNMDTVLLTFWDRTKQHAHAVLSTILRALLALATISIAVAAGIAVPTLLSAHVAQWPAASFALGSATVLAVAKDLIKTLPTAWDFIVSNKTDSVPRLFADVAVAALGLGCAWFAIAKPDVVGSSLPPIILNEHGSVFTTYIIFDEWKSELGTIDAQRDQVKALVGTLADCIQSPNDQVQLRVRAYASSSGGDKENMDLYKARASYVSDLLNSDIAEVASEKQNQFKIALQDWHSMPIMKIRRLFRDTDTSGKYHESAGALNRRAEILVESAGSCLSG